jgi:hypothetical protein
MINYDNNYVEVAEEPMHVEHFKNEHFRLYIATIPPGESTLYHRHSEDTLYIVLDGGLIRNEYYNDKQINRILFPKSVKLLTILYLGLQSVFARHVYFPGKLFFLMANKKRESIHRAITSIENKRNMRLMGIEIFFNPISSDPINLNGKSFKNEFMGNGYSVFTLSLKQNESSSIDQTMVICLLVCLKGKMRINCNDDQAATENIIKENDYLMMKSSGTLIFTNSGKEEAKIIMIFIYQ